MATGAGATWATPVKRLAAWASSPASAAVTSPPAAVAGRPPQRGGQRRDDPLDRPVDGSEGERARKAGCKRQPRDFARAGASFETCRLAAARSGIDIVGAKFDQDNYRKDPVEWRR
ncbi:hypothetical protein ACFPOI_00900 [Nonomuraea angiospora]|uniref:Excalibur calcium-binding domain-containing protein n=1 Tax=Nonomuraea angiospora TaxID=46172 RepID=A0ABR9M317_9ACTN|nr:hypothetical protein [Nonomuraea angiospora]MBE1586962.1 hypothetical protein [Nonomuraea angiospora]